MTVRDSAVSDFQNLNEHKRSTIFYRVYSSITVYQFCFHVSFVQNIIEGTMSREFPATHHVIYLCPVWSSCSQTKRIFKLLLLLKDSSETQG